MVNDHYMTGLVVMMRMDFWNEDIDKKLSKELKLDQPILCVLRSGTIYYWALSSKR